MLRQSIVEQRKDRENLIKQLYQSRKILENMRHMRQVADSDTKQYYNQFQNTVTKSARMEARSQEKLKAGKRSDNSRMQRAVSRKSLK